MRPRILPTLNAAILFTAATVANALPVTQATPPAASAPASQMADSGQSSPAASTKAAADATATAATPEKKICKLLPSSYSHTSQRVCLTKNEWKQVEEQMR